MADTNGSAQGEQPHADLAQDASNLTSQHAPPAEDERAAKRQKTNDTEPSAAADLTMKDSVPGQDLHDAPSKQENNGEAPKVDNRKTNVAPVKKEYIIERTGAPPAGTTASNDDDEAEGRTDTRHARDSRDDRDNGGGKKGKDKKKAKGGQNTERSFGYVADAIRLCNSRAMSNEFSPRECKFGDRCKMGHDLRKYLEEGRREDVTIWDGQCPVYAAHGKCPSGWKCRFVKSHMREVEHDDGRKELCLLDNDAPPGEGEAKAKDEQTNDEQRPAVYNVVDMQIKTDLNRKRTDFKQADQYIQWLNQQSKTTDEYHQARRDATEEDLQAIRAQFVDPPFKPSEKRRLYFGPETPALAPLTTQGNLPFRRLCVELGAQLTYSEMAMGMPMIQGYKADWTLLKAHESEIAPPTISPTANIVHDYDHARDLRFGAQVSANQPWIATKVADVLHRFVPHLRLIDLNCGCPIDMIYKNGAGSALLESHGKLERMIRGMNALSGEIPITAKIRTGVRNNRPTAHQVIEKLAFGSRDQRDRLGAPGCAAITLHGRSREQRYTKKADWSFIADCAALIKGYNDKKDSLTDTAAEPDPSTLANGGHLYFLGNGDCYSHEDYHQHIADAGVDSVMIGRGALIKPWLFEEIEKGQYLDKSSTERLGYIEKFVKYGLDAWGSDELGIQFTRRFLLEWLSFTHRYIPVGLLERLPPDLNDRPPAYKGRDELETLMASNNYLDWIKITEMFLGPVHPGFKFQPKHKSNAYEAEG
ncbi:uncharacterized protein F5Z01DRAFT_619449 [Emericellopsis atlantica]|uniref:tRNA-dihydrouridine(47) synthase [NAD(P)(+)] n=1 Tax=Emericellopsis atlantica TaxID=2614577 RepID=A0A9P8CSP6_9HYPO|nr:uncharacterized protein F5Z01DRAFT_619449 [Emericellopsis atlantica]KAG9255961.1 hypothetical protein F5Z01DRAFT_619449 [Emericellopsis atlantica]